MSWFDGSVAEVLLDAEHVDPGFGQREADGHVLARYLAVLAADVAGHEDVGAQLHLGAADAEGGAHLQRQLAVLGRPDAETQQFDVAGVGRFESEGRTGSNIEWKCESKIRHRYRRNDSLDHPRIFKLALIDAAVKLDVFQADPLFGDDGDDVVPTDHFPALSRQIVDAQFHVGHSCTTQSSQSIEMFRP